MTNPNILGRLSIHEHVVQLNRKAGVQSCECCGLKTANDRDVGLFMVISIGDKKTDMYQESLSVCVFCSQALTLSTDSMADGVLYLLPELDQASVIRLVVAANCFVFATQSPNSLVSSNTQELAFHTRTRCVKAARAFLDALSRVGVERTTKVSRQALCSQELVEHLRILELGESQELALKNVSEVVRFVPIMSANNMPLISFLSKSYWGLPQAFSRCVTAFEHVEQQLEIRSVQNSPS